MRQIECADCCPIKRVLKPKAMRVQADVSASHTPQEMNTDLTPKGLQGDEHYVGAQLIYC